MSKIWNGIRVDSRLYFCFQKKDEVNIPKPLPETQNKINHSENPVRLGENGATARCFQSRRLSRTSKAKEI